MPRLISGHNVIIKVSMPRELAGRLELALMDKAHGRPIYGARSAVIRQLIQDWIAAGAVVDPAMYEVQSQ